MFTPRSSLRSLLRILRKEREIVGQISDLGLSAPQAIDLLTHEAVMLSQAENRVVNGLFDASDRPEGGGIIMWWNDLEKDSRFVVYPLYIYVIYAASR
jgi:UDP-glucose:glycoprotein glucosyltransferase